MSEALKMVKAEMGLDAMILSSKQERRRGILGFFSKPYFEVTAALEQKKVQRPVHYQEKPERELSTREEFQNSMLAPLARELRELRERVEVLAKKDAEKKDAEKKEALPPTAAEKSEDEIKPFQPQKEGNAPRIFAREDMEEIKKLLLNAVAAKEEKGSKPVSFPVVSTEDKVCVKNLADDCELSDEALELLANELRSEEVGTDSIHALLELIRPAAELGEELEALRERLVDAFAGIIKCSGPLRLRKTGPRIMATVGPTGVGKTTTIAKLAAMYALNRGARVAMVTTDNFRVGAVEQLKTYSKIMDVPLEVAATAKELEAVLAKHADKDLILIDTAGRSPKDREKLEELKVYLESCPGIETYLCISATTRDREMNEIVAQYSLLPITRLLFTKLDESESYGCIVNAQVRNRFPLSYFTTGQKVPEDIEVATARKLANLVLRETEK
ncbi:flagellar biosynthesis protein FlhF [Geotalea toluenoxydans]